MARQKQLEGDKPLIGNVSDSTEISNRKQKGDSVETIDSSISSSGISENQNDDVDISMDKGKVNGIQVRQDKTKENENKGEEEEKEEKLDSNVMAAMEKDLNKQAAQALKGNQEDINKMKDTIVETMKKMENVIANEEIEDSDIEDESESESSSSSESSVSSESSGED